MVQFEAMGAQVTDTGSTVPRRQLGRYLREAREKAGISVAAAATYMESYRDRMYRLEAGRTSARRHEIIAICLLYKLDEDMATALTQLASETRAKGWWHAYGEAVPTWFDLYLGLEAAANRLRHFAPALVPGLLQTPGYAAALFRLRSGRTEEEIAQSVALRVERQRLLAERCRHHLDWRS